MATPYEIVDNSFLNKITDDILLSLLPEDIESLLDKYRVSASIKFKQCKKLGDKDNDLRVFNQDLTDEEVEILSNLMVLEWLKPQINSIELLKQSLTTKDYKFYSQANHLETLQKLRSETQSEINKLIVSYTYSTNTLNNLKRGV